MVETLVKALITVVDILVKVVEIRLKKQIVFLIGTATSILLMTTDIAKIAMITMIGTNLEGMLI